MNREAERKRLVEQIKVSLNKHIGKSCLLAENIASDLLANGIVVPPVKVGQTVYQITRNFISEFRVRFIEIGTCGNMFLHTDLISGIILTGEVFPESEIGKTVFTSREQAEQALVNYKSSKNDDM